MKGLFKRNTMLKLQVSNFHSKYLIIGAGAGGMSVSGQLLNEGLVNDPKDITIIDPAHTHYYQPGFTKIASQT